MSRKYHDIRVVLWLGGMFFLVSNTLFAQDIYDIQGDSIKIDKIVIEKNWITWNSIIRAELEFKEGDVVHQDQINRSTDKVWNIGNFSDVYYSIDKTDTGNYLTITALDAVKFYPLISIDHSSKEDYNYSLGFVDDNFLGSNTGVNLKWNKQPIGVSYSFRFSIPRQLLYKNMTLAFGVTVGNEIKRYLDREITYDDKHRVESVAYVPQMLSPVDKFECYVHIGNPWHLDDSYRFSPDLSLSYAHHKTNLNLLSPEEAAFDVELSPFDHSLFSIGVSESMGLINRKRHRLDGYSVGVSYGLTLGLNPQSPNYQSFGLSAQYHKIFNPIIQFSSRINTGYTTADIPYRYIGGGSDVIGLRQGEIYGKLHYSVYTGMHFTWLNKNWLVLENAYFVNWGAGADTFGKLFSHAPKYSVGTSFKFVAPLVPFVFLKISFMYAGPGSEWYKINF